MGCVGIGLFSLGIEYVMTEVDPRDVMEKDRDYDRVFWIYFLFYQTIILIFFLH